MRDDLEFKAFVCSARKPYTQFVVNESGQDSRSLAEPSESRLVPQLESGGDPFQVFRIVWRRLWVVLLAIVVCVGLAVGYSFQETPTYQASIKILVGQDRGLFSEPSQAVSLQSIALTLSEIVATRPVAEDVVQSLDLKRSPEDIVNGTSAAVVPDTQIIVVTFTDTDPIRAQQIANAIGDAFSKQVTEVSPRVSALSAVVWERAAVPQSPVSPNPLRNGLMAFVVGSMLGVGIALLLEYLDNSWQSPEEAEQVSGLPILGVIPEFEKTKKSGKA